MEEEKREVGGRRGVYLPQSRQRRSGHRSTGGNSFQTSADSAIFMRGQLSLSLELLSLRGNDDERGR